jgi:signal transduction histidine kinase
LKRARGKEQLAALGVAASTITHKLKNSIVSLKTYAELLPERRKDDQFMQKFERVFEASVHHLESMFKNLSQVAVHRKLDWEPVCLPDLFEKLELVHAEALEKIAIDFRLEAEPNLPVIYGDREYLYEALVNLIQNSIQAMPNGGALTIRAKCRVSGESAGRGSFVEISVEDNGEGISPENLSRIFEPFFTTKHSGMGLGLAVCKKIVGDHKGMIQVTSHKGEGTIFTIRLPTVEKKKVQIQSPIEVMSSQ